MSANIYVGNLPYEVTNESLQQIFEKYGEVVSAKVINDKRTGRSKGFGFVEMTSDSEAQNAIQGLNNTEVKGRNIKVNIAKPKSY